MDVDAPHRRATSAAAGAVDRDATVAVELLWNTPSVTARFDGVGVVPLEVCRAIGLVGVAARACGLQRDVRRDFPYGIFRFAHIPGIHLGYRRRVRPGLRSLAGSPAVAGFLGEQLASPAGGRRPRTGRPAAAGRRWS